MDRSSMNSAPWIAVFFLGTCALACSDEDPQPDGGVMPQMDAIDDWDSGSNDVIIRDAASRDADPPDLGAPDVGGCGCSYGFQQQCPEDEYCGGGFEGESRCVRAEPFGSAVEGGCSMVATATGAGGASCNAQCVPTSVASPCSSVGDRGILAGAISSWGNAIRYASTMRPGPGPHAMRSEDITNARDSAPTPECGVFAMRTVIAAVSLCRGEGAVIPPDPGSNNVPSAWKFRHFDESDACLDATGLCIGALSAGVGSDVGAASAVDEIPMFCPNGLPYAAPCQGPDAQRCLRARMESMIRALNEE
jgi:hypothetical protein